MPVLCRTNSTSHHPDPLSGCCSICLLPYKEVPNISFSIFISPALTGTHRHVLYCRPVLRAHATQCRNPDGFRFGRRETVAITTPDSLKCLEMRHRVFSHCVGPFELTLNPTVMPSSRGKAAFWPPTRPHVPSKLGKLTFHLENP